MSKEPTQTDRMWRKQHERIEAFALHGIKATRGQCLGWISLSAAEAEKLLRLLNAALAKARGK